jgi:hypothetical protein
MRGGLGVGNKAFKGPCCGSRSMPPCHFTMLPIRPFNLLDMLSRVGVLTWKNGKKWRAQAGAVSKATFLKQSTRVELLVLVPEG